MPFSCIAPGADETRQAGERPHALVVRLARAKAVAVALQHPDAWVIGSDQVAVRADASGELILGKPATEARCIEQLRGCSGQTLSFVTAVAVIDDATIARYVAREAPLDCAGGFKSEGLGITLCASIIGVDPSALIGLPLIQLSKVLRGVGYELP